MNIENIISKLDLSNDLVVRKQENASQYARLLLKLGKTCF